jgi:acetoin utilization protein AcuB
MNSSSLSVGHYMTRAPYAISPGDLLGAARRLMDEHAIRHLPVQVGGKLVGILSDRDLQLVWSLAHAPPEALTVEDAMTPEPYAVGPNTPLGEVVGVLSGRKIGSAVVLDGERIVGVFTSTDAMHALADVLGDDRADARWASPGGHAPAPAIGRDEGGRAVGDGAEGRVRRSVMRAAQLDDLSAVDEAIAVAMGALAARLTAGEAHAVLDGLPHGLRSMFRPCVLHREGRPTQRLDRAELVERVREQLGVTPARAEVVCAAVFSAVRRELPEKLVLDVSRQLPRGLVQLWFAAPPRHGATADTLAVHEVRGAIEREIEAATSLPPDVTGEDVFAAVMCAFSERLSRGEARELLLGLPENLRPLVERCITHRAEPAQVFGRDELVRRVEGLLRVDASQAETLVSAVLAAVKRVLPERAAHDVRSQLPADLLELWDRG